MKNRKIFVCFLLILLITVFTVCGCVSNSYDNSEFLRLHIRADSNLDADQNVKWKVRDAVINHLTPLLKDVQNATDAKSVIKKELTNLKNISEKVLLENGFSYGAEAVVKKEEFPTKSYGDVVLESGTYEAVIINLGSGKGDNWWCVAYPPLCFIGEGDDTGIKYKSVIKEIIEKWRKNVSESEND